MKELEPALKAAFDLDTFNLWEKRGKKTKRKPDNFVAGILALAFSRYKAWRAAAKVIDSILKVPNPQVSTLTGHIGYLGGVIESEVDYLTALTSGDTYSTDEIKSSISRLRSAVESDSEA